MLTWMMEDDNDNDTIDDNSSSREKVGKDLLEIARK